MSGIQFSVVICTHNPRADYLDRVFANLEAQTLSRNQWELILIDNASTPPIDVSLDPSIVLPRKTVREETPGLVAARIRGLQEASGEWLVYVDDDNLLAPNYLEELRQLTATHPYVALWMAEIHPEYEVQPPAKTKPFWPYLAIRNVGGTRWSNIPENAPLACGAGMAVRRDVITRWTQDVVGDPARRGLGRKNNSLLAGEDSDIGLTTFDLGLGIGESNKLQLIHLIPARRIERSYLRKIAYSVVYSHALLNLTRGRVGFMGLGLKIVLFTRDGIACNRNLDGVALWWAQVRGVAAAWIQFKMKAKSS